MDNANIQAFKKLVLDFYKKNGRHELPWRNTRNPYKIAVSEIMLQQTQVPRVIEKYNLFLKAFPTTKALATAPLSDVLKIWVGLGYNRRAKFLKVMAEMITNQYKGKFPTTKEALLKLPGIGPYTAGAIMAFAYNTPETIIETNIRTVYIHHFFKDRELVSDKELFPLITKTVDINYAREWYWALMDYGSHLKSTGNIIHRKSKHYAKQSAFTGSKRSVRGHIIRVLSKGSATLSELKKNQPKTEYSIEEVLIDLLSEGLLQKKGSTYFISDL